MQTVLFSFHEKQLMIKLDRFYFVNLLCLKIMLYFIGNPAGIGKGTGLGQKGLDRDGIGLR